MNLKPAVPCARKLKLGRNLGCQKNKVAPVITQYCTTVLQLMNYSRNSFTKVHVGYFLDRRMSSGLEVIGLSKFKHKFKPESHDFCTNFFCCPCKATAEEMMK